MKGQHKSMYKLSQLVSMAVDFHKRYTVGKVAQLSSDIKFFAIGLDVSER